MLAAGQRGIPARRYTPQQVKGAVCGTGRAAKDQVARMVQALLGLPDAAAPDHAADALAVAICHANHAPLAARWRWPDDRARRRRGRGAPPRPRRRRDRRRASATAWPCRPRRCARCPAVGRRRSSLHAHLVVRDDALALYGFATEEERDLFLLLIGVQSRGAEGGARRAPRRHAARAGRARWRPATRAPAGGARASASARPSGSSSSCARRSACRTTLDGADHRAPRRRPAPRSPATACSSSASQPAEAAGAAGRRRRARRPRSCWPARCEERAR